MEVIPAGGDATGSVDLLASGYRYEGERVLVTGVVRNGMGSTTYIGFVAVGYNAYNEAIEVGYSGSSYAYSRNTWGSSVTQH